MSKNVFCIIVMLALFSCKRDEGSVTAYVPVYADKNEVLNIELAPPEKLVAGGKVFVSDNILYQVEIGRGIHLTDISDPSLPVKKAFIKSRGCQEVAVKNHLIITNNASDLVILALSDNAIRVVRRLPGSFDNLLSPNHPPERGRFECPDPSKGIVIGWEKKTINNPSCSY